MQSLENEIKITLENFNAEMQAIRTNRPNPAMVENIKVDVYGQPMAINQTGSISIVPPNRLIITPWDAQNVETISKALETGQYGFRASVMGNFVQIDLPPLSQERREELKKLAGSTAEKFRIQLRAHRDHENKALAKEELSEDEAARAKKDIQKKIDDANMAIENTLEGKISELDE